MYPNQIVLKGRSSDSLDTTRDACNTARDAIVEATASLMALRILA